MKKNLTDQAKDTLDFYSRPDVFSDDFKVGTEVVPAFATQYEGQGVGVITSVTDDRKSALVRFKGMRVGVVIEPYEVYLREEK